MSDAVPQHPVAPLSDPLDQADALIVEGLAALSFSHFLVTRPGSPPEDFATARRELETYVQKFREASKLITERYPETCRALEGQV